MKWQQLNWLFDSPIDGCINHQPVGLLYKPQVCELAVLVAVYELTVEITKR
jgi:hypothetical protein